MTSVPAAARRRRREELRDFLRTRRARLTPGAVGMAAVGRRRTPGLRREEVAALAGVGVSWYTWLEQGRDINASPEVLDAISRALRLTDPERAHLYVLAGLNPPRAGGSAVTPELLQSLVLAVRSDAASLPDLDELMATIRARHGRPDVVFANAGVASFGPYGDVAEAEFDRVVDINFKGVYFTVQKALPLLSDGAAIVINASWTLHRGLPGGSLYSATKAAVHNLAHTLAAELAPRRIRVNSVSPGYIETAMFHENVPEKEHAGVVANVAAGRLGTAEDVADAVAFLASAEAS